VRHVEEAGYPCPTAATNKKNMLERLNIRPEYQQTLRRLGWFVLLLVSIGAVFTAAEQKAESLVTELVIDIKPLKNGARFIQPEDIRLLIEGSFGYKMEGRSLASVDVERLERLLEEDPFILDADAFLASNNKLKIKIVQREPILRVMDNNGFNYYLDINGVKMPPSPHFAAKVLVATGNLPPYEPNFLERKRNTLADAFRLAKLLLEDEFFRPMIEQVHLSNRGEMILIPMLGGQKIAFGKFENAPEKLRNLRAFYREILPYEGWRKYSEISVQYSGQVVCKK
jgi:cell division protein FtsQ